MKRRCWFKVTRGYYHLIYIVLNMETNCFSTLNPSRCLLEMMAFAQMSKDFGLLHICICYLARALNIYPPPPRQGTCLSQFCAFSAFKYLSTPRDLPLSDIYRLCLEMLFVQINKYSEGYLRIIHVCRLLIINYLNSPNTQS